MTYLGNTATSSPITSGMYQGEPILSWNPIAQRYYYPGERDQQEFLIRNQMIFKQASQKQEKKQMFDIVTVKTFAGTVGQVINRENREILWESRPYTKPKKKDGLTMGPLELAHLAAMEAADLAVRNLFKEIPSV